MREKYLYLAAQLLDGSLNLADFPNCLADIPRLIEPDTISLLTEAIQRSHDIPREGWALATVIYEAARCSGNTNLQMQGALTLAETLIYWERFNQALQVLSSEPLLGHIAQDGDILTYYQAQSEWLRGLTLSRMARVGEAMQSLRQAEAPLRQYASQDEIMRWQCDVARVEMLQAHYDQALQLAQSSLEYFRSKPDCSGYKALCELVLAAIYYYQGEYAIALEWLTVSIAGLKVAGWTADHVRAQMIVAQTYERQLNFSEAIALCEQTRPMLESLDLVASLARCDNTLGLAYLHRGNPSTAVSYFERASDGFMHAGIFAFAADSELNLGVVFHDQGDFQTAIAQYQRARNLYQQHPAQMAYCEHNIGRCYREMGDYSRALDHFARAESTFAELGLKTDLALCRHNIAFTYGLMNDNEHAADLYNQALAIYEEVGLHLWSAECRTQLAQIAAGQGEVDIALSQIQRARQTCTDAGYEPGVAICDQTTGDVLSNAGQLQASIGYYQNAGRIFNHCGRLVDAALCDLGLVHAYFQEGDLAQAQVCLERASALIDERMPDIAWQAEALRSQLTLTQGCQEEALSAAMRAVAYLNRARRGLADESLVNVFMNSARSRAYDHALRMALQMDYLEDALLVIEERRAQIIAEQLRWPAHFILSGSPRLDELSHRRAHLQMQISELRSTLQPGFDTGASADTQATVQALAQLRSLANDYEQVIIEAHNAGWSALESPRDMPLFSLDLFRQAMESGEYSGWTCLNYAWLDDELIIVHLNDQGNLDVTHLQLNPLDRMALRMMSQPEPAWREAMYFQPGLAGEMYRRRAYKILIPPAVQDELAPDRLLVVVPSGLLHHIPFAALEADGIFLTQQAVLCIAPSLQAMALLHTRSNTNRRDEHGRLLAVSVDTFGNGISALPFVEQEVEALLQLWQGKATVLRNSDATTNMLRQLSDNNTLLTYRILHFATHAIFGGEFGRLSRLLLDSGNLFVDDIRALRLAADLVVLSACQTGLGQVCSGDEIIGLVYSFLAAGAQAVIASLWHINDPSVTPLIERFYRELGQGKPPAMALALAQRSAIADGWPPYLWAQFMLTGYPWNLAESLEPSQV